jgi:hypothetical protein
MLYKMKSEDGSRTLEPVAFMDFAELGKIEKDLENLLAANLLDVLFEDASLMPICQERPIQAEADLYALDRAGDLVIFELKRGYASSDAMLQALRYGQEAGQWTYDQLERKYREYSKDESISLAEAHKEAFSLERALVPADFNQRQRFVIVGNAANDELVDAVDYWKRRGLSVEFLPYRLYAIKGEHYFEFFALPYDRHRNPSEIKGVLFDTNRSWDEDAVWQMMENRWVAAYGDVSHVVDSLQPKDIVFYWHTREGVIAAAEVIGPAHNGPPNGEGSETRYRQVRFLTPVPTRAKGITRCMSRSELVHVTGKRFFLARTIKVPYLSKDEAGGLLAALNHTLAS